MVAVESGQQDRDTGTCDEGIDRCAEPIGLVRRWPAEQQDAGAVLDRTVQDAVGDRRIDAHPPARIEALVGKHDLAAAHGLFRAFTVGRGGILRDDGQRRHPTTVRPCQRGGDLAEIPGRARPRHRNQQV